MIPMEDSKKVKSQTLGMVKIAFIMICVAFGKVIVTGEASDIIGALPLFGTGIMTILAPWVGREWVKR